MGFLAVASGVATYATLTGLVPYHPTTAAVIALLLTNLLLVLSLGALIIWRLVRLWIDRRSGIAGARLHVRLVVIFSAIAVIPAIMVAVFAAVSLDLGLEAWFSAHVKAALGSAVHVADRYVQSNESQIVGDAYEIANTIEHDPELFDPSNRVHADILFTKLAILTKDRGLQAAYIIDSHGHVLGSTKQRFLPDIALPRPGDIAQASHGTIVIDANAKVGVVRGLIRMQALNDAYLLVVRTVDPQVLAYYQHTANAVSESYVGGLVGYNDANISNSYATGAVTGNNVAVNVTDGIGGLVGVDDSKGSITGSYATGAVMGTNADQTTGAIGARRLERWRNQRLVRHGNGDG